MLSIPRSEIGSVRIDDILLEFRERDGGGKHYRGRTHFEEATSPFYPLLRNALSPRYCLDIGANYGFTGLLMHRAFPACHLTLVEPIPWLSEFIRHNFEVNGKGFDRFYPSVVGAVPGRTTFGVNTNASQDSRVIPQTGWDVIETETITLSDLTADIPSDQGVYIKIDTQGWEENVFLGAEAFLTRHPRWFVKTEFAPMWLESQGSDPVRVLEWLLSRFQVYEHTGRFRWNCTTLADGMGAPLMAGTAPEFVRHVRALNVNGTGWVDLFVAPLAQDRDYDLSQIRVQQPHPDLSASPSTW